MSLPRKLCLRGRLIPLLSLARHKKIFDLKIELGRRVKTSRDRRGNEALLKKLV
jgi:hypothetical protein